MKQTYITPSIRVKEIAITSLLIGSGDNAVAEDNITDPTKIAAKEGFDDIYMEDSDTDF